MWTSTSGWAAATSFDAGDGDVLVLLAEMQKRRDAGLQFLKPDDPAAVIADGGAQALKPPRRRPGDRAAEAEADYGDLAAFLGDFDRGGDVAQHLLAINPAGDRHAARSRVSVVAGLELGLDMLENRRRHGEVALGREPVGDVADMRIDAEDLLDDDDPAARRLLRDRRARLESGPPLPASVQSTRPCPISSRSSGA